MPPVVTRRDAALAAGLAAVLGAAALASATGPAATTSHRMVRVVHEREVLTPALTQTTDTVDPTLTTQIRTRLSRASGSGFAAVVDIAGRGRVVRISATTGTRPASTQKLFTTLPLLLANPDRTLVTQVRASAKPVNGIVNGNLIVKAVRDPSVGWGVLRDLAHQVRAAGIRRVTGKLRIDIGGRTLATRRSGWKWDSVPSDIGPLSPFPVAQDWYRHDSGYLAHPTLPNGQQFRRVLGNAGVHVWGGVDVVRSSSATLVVASHSSVRMSSLVRNTLVYSNNFYAESLLYIEGADQVHQLVDNAQIPDSYQTDGSGLSYTDRESARGEVKLLEYAASSSAADQLVASLPVACRSGTLADRFCGTIADGMVWAKTGTLQHTRALSGYTYDGDNRRVTFSILVWGVQDLTKAQRWIDNAVVLLRGYTG